MAAQRPPTPWYLGYRFLGLRLPAEYRQWVAEDVAGKTYLNWRLVRSFLWGAVLVGCFYLAIWAEYEKLGWRRAVQMLAAAMAYTLLLTRKAVVRRTLRWQRVDKRGRPVAPKGFGLLTQAEGVAAVTALAVLATGAAAVFGYNLNPDGPRGAKCKPPSKEIQARLVAGFKKPGVTLVVPRTVKYSTGQVIATLYREPGEAKATNFIALLVGNDGTIYEVNRQMPNAPDTVTTFGRAPSADRVSSEALIRAVECMSKAAPR